MLRKTIVSLLAIIVITVLSLSGALARGGFGGGGGRGGGMGGDSFFYYTGSYSQSRGKWRGEMIVHQHTEAPGLNLAFGGREVTCGFTGTYSEGSADIDGTALVGSYSVPFRARLTLKVPA